MPITTTTTTTATPTSALTRGGGGGGGGSKNQVINFWAAECRYSVILDVVSQQMKWRLIEEERLASKVNLFWIDVAAINERFRTILPWQMINHFPGMPNIARKNRMGQNLNRMQRLFPKEYSFYPRTWVLPSELNEFRNQFDTNGNALNNRIFIIKPDAGCQGRGILLTRSLDQVPITENVVAQIYVKKPFLLDNYKFDLRIYLYITSIKPLRMYLFHDGLVRMCTEEYVKPTRSNLHQLCMHLTNYAVNKHNNNFTQPNSINIEDQENSSKRSLQWFMFYIAEKYGIEKANWLWKRIGVVCTRTVLSILPTLSREYDAHFRTFNNIPVDSKKIPRPGGVGGGGGKGGKVGGGGGSSKKGSSSSSRGRSLGNNKSLNGNSSDSGGGEEEQEEEEEEGEEEQEEEEGQDEGGAGGGGSSSTEQGIDNYDKDGATSSSSSSSCSPQIRGSRCIEVLGFDIMIDDKLNPTLIEVNHLPSFGTDSALDLDVKERLMQQVFSVLPCLPDDAVAYGYQMKVEAERRQAEKMLAMENSRAQAQKVWRTGNAPPLIGRRRDGTSVERSNSRTTRGAGAGGGGGGGSGNNTGGGGGGGGGSVSPPLGTNEEEQKNSDSTTTTAPPPPTAPPAPAPSPPPIEIIDEECTPERIEEIKRILREIYTIYSAEKINKIDRLLQKYVGHEEEFLRFVYAKYNVSPATYEKEKYARLAAATANAANAAAATMVYSNEGENSGGGGGGDDGGGGGGEGDNGDNESVRTDSQVNHRNNAAEGMAKRISRSLSPPRTKKTPTSGAGGGGGGGNGNVNGNSAVRRMSAAWKAPPDEEAQYRQDILREHVPEEEEEWMRYEMSKLTQFTRVFPPLPKEKEVDYITAVRLENPHLASQAGLSVGGGGDGGVGGGGGGFGNTTSMSNDNEEEEEKEEEEEDEDGGVGGVGGGGGGGTTSATAPSSSSSSTPTGTAPKKKIATYEDIIYQVFLQDRRQTMRLRCPLPNRSKMDDGFLPPLDGSSSARPLPSSSSSSTTSNTSSMTGKGVVGWKAPPKSKEGGAGGGGGVKQPTASQLESAKRLSQGLSVASTSTSSSLSNSNSSSARSRRTSSIQTTVEGTCYSVVLDPQECGGAGGGGFYPPPQDSATTLWPSTKANRLYEEARRNRLRVEAQRSQNGAVLRQQVFFFDPNYENNSMANLAAAAAAAMAMHHQQGLHPHPTNGPSPVMGHLGLPLSVGGGGGVVGGGGGGGHPDGLAALGRSSSSKLAANAAGLLFSTPSLSQQQQQQQAQLPPSSSSQVSYGHHINAGTLSQQQLQLQQNGAGGGGGGGGGGKQEELLKQLFPSWF